MQREKREELEQLTDRNDLSMATVVKMKMSIDTIGGGDHVGDSAHITAREQFIHTSAKTSLGYCLGSHAVHLCRGVLDTPERLEEFKDGVINCIEEELYTIRTELEKLDKKTAEDETT